MTDWNTLSTFFEFALSLATEKARLLLDTSILYALYPRTERDADIRERVVSLFHNMKYMCRTSPSWKHALSRGASHQEAIRWVQQLFERVKLAVSPLGIDIVRIVATEPDDLNHHPF